MIGNILVTIMLFVAAVGLCVVLNFYLIKSALEFIPVWMERLMYIGCVVVIFSMLYATISAIWGGH